MRSLVQSQQTLQPQTRHARSSTAGSIGTAAIASIPRANPAAKGRDASDLLCEVDEHPVQIRYVNRVSHVGWVEFDLECMFQQQPEASVSELGSPEED